MSASVLARRSGMMAQETSASAFGSRANGFFSLKRITLSDGADSSSVRYISVPPNGLRLPKRCIVATQSRASTGVPSWNISPSRNVRSHCLPSSLITWPSTICGCTLNVGVVAVQRVIDGEREVARDIRGRPHGIERGQVGMRREIDGLGPFGAGDTRRGRAPRHRQRRISGHHGVSCCFDLVWDCCCSKAASFRCNRCVRQQSAPACRAVATTRAAAIDMRCPSWPTSGTLITVQAQRVPNTLPRHGRRRRSCALVRAAWRPGAWSAGLLGRSVPWC